MYYVINRSQEIIHEGSHSDCLAYVGTNRNLTIYKASDYEYKS